MTDRASTSRGDARGRTGLAALCSAYGYPDELKRLLERIVAAVQPVAPRSVLLHGSASRGEFTWWRDGQGRMRFASDLEMYVVTDAAVAPSARERVNAAVAALAEEASAADDSLFHIDLGFTTVEGLSRHPRTFRCWDTRTTGWTLSGEDLKDALPELDATTIDMRQLNEVPIHRLWEMVFRFPAAMLHGRATARDEQLFAYVVARQALDLTTWLLPHVGIMVPTFRKRVAVWEERYEELPLARYFDRESGAFLRECLRGKTDLQFDRPARELHERTFEYFHSALRMVLGISPGATTAETTAAIRDQAPRHWNRRGARRRLYEMFVVFRSGRGPATAWRWWKMRKYPLQVATLLRMNEALSHLLNGRDAGEALDAMERLLGELWYEFEPVRGSDVDRLIHARRGYVDYLVGSSRWFGPRRDYLYGVIADG